MSPKQLFQILLLSTLWCSLPATAAFDVFLQIPGIEGESQDQDFRGAIDVLSLDWDVGSTSRVKKNGGASCKIAVGPVTLLKKPDLSSTDLLMAQITGEVLPEAVVSFVRSGGDMRERLTFLKLTLFNARVTSYNLSSRSGDDIPVESAELSFDSGFVEYTAQTRTGDEGERKEVKFQAGKCL